MATQNATLSDPQGDGSVITAKWVLTNTDDGAPFFAPQWADRSAQVGITSDTFGTGTIVIEGSNDGTTWTQLRNPQGVSLAFTAAGLNQILENTTYIRPRASAAVTSVTIILCARRATPMRT